MPDIALSASTYERVTDLARAWNTSEDGAICRVLDFWKSAGAGPPNNQDEVRVHAVYGGQGADGVFHPSTGLVDIISGPAAGRSGLKPSPAATAVVAAVNPGVSPNRNGWGFWIVDATGEPLQSLRARPRSARSS